MDFINGIANGIRNAIGNVVSAISSVASDMVIRPQMAVAGYGAMKLPDRMSAEGGLSGITSAITEAISQLNGQGGDIVIPVYLGGTMLDEVIVNAQQRANLRSGER